MKFNTGDIIDDEYLVIDSLEFNGKNYVYVNFNENENTILEVFEENGEDYIQNIEDDKEFEQVMYKFVERAKVVLKKEGNI